VRGAAGGVSTTLIGRLAADALSRAEGDAEAAARRLVATLRANKFPLLACREALPPALAATEGWQRALVEDEESFRRQRDEYLRVREAWARAGISCLAFKSAGTFPSFPYTGDNLDLLVPREACPRARAVLEEMGYVWLRNIDEPRKFLFRRFRGGRSVLAMHVHAWVGWDVEFMDDTIWQRARAAPDDAALTVPGPEDCILVNVAHALYENKRFTLYDLHKVTAHWADPGLDWDYVEGLARRRGWHDGLLLGLLACALMERLLLGASTAPPARTRRWREGLRAYPWADAYWRVLAGRRRPRAPFPVSFAFSKLLYYRKVLADGRRPPRRRSADLARVLAWGLKQKAGLRPQPGLLVSLSGLDGAGKSSVARALAAALRTSEVRCRVVWTRCGCSPAYRAAAGLVRRLTRADASGAGGAWRPAPAGKTLRTLWTSVNVADVLLHLAWRAWLPRLLGKAVVCDRYAYDAAVEMASRLGDDGALPLRLLLSLAPRPDYAFLLDVPPGVARVRSRDPAPLWALAEQRRLYLALAVRRGLRTVDATAPVTDVADAVTLPVLRGYQDRFHTLLDGLLLSNPSQLNPDDPQAWTPARR